MRRERDVFIGMKANEVLVRGIDIEPYPADVVNGEEVSEQADQKRLADPALAAIHTEDGGDDLTSSKLSHFSDFRIW